MYLINSSTEKGESGWVAPLLQKCAQAHGVFGSRVCVWACGWNRASPCLLLIRGTFRQDDLSVCLPSGPRGKARTSPLATPETTRVLPAQSACARGSGSGPRAAVLASRTSSRFGALAAGTHEAQCSHRPPHHQSGLQVCATRDAGKTVPALPMLAFFLLTHTDGS